jgi:hypothetical protein
MAVELEDHVALAARDEHRLADRPAALRDDGVDHHVAVERHADEAATMHLVVQIERVLTRPAAAAGETAHQHRVGMCGVDGVEQRFHVDAEGIRQQDQLRRLSGQRRGRGAGAHERRERHVGQAAPP